MEGPGTTAPSRIPGSCLPVQQDGRPMDLERHQLHRSRVDAAGTMLGHRW